MKIQNLLSLEVYNETVIYDFGDYISDNLATCKAEKASVPSVEGIVDFSWNDEDLLEELGP